MIISVKVACKKCGKYISREERNMNSGKCNDCKSDETADAESSQNVE